MTSKKKLTKTTKNRDWQSNHRTNILEYRGHLEAVYDEQLIPMANRVARRVENWAKAGATMRRIPLKIGDTVQHKSGGPVMTIDDVIDENTVSCTRS
jgi:hypothetical protein